MSLQVLFATVGLVSGFFILVATLVVKAQVAQPRTGAAGLVGEIGVVKKTIFPEGKVFVHGELWQAVAKTPIEEGMKVRVVAVEHLVLTVVPLETVPISGAQD